MSAASPRRGTGGTSSLDGVTRVYACGLIVGLLLLGACRPLGSWEAAGTGTPDPQSETDVATTSVEPTPPPTEVFAGEGLPTERVAVEEGAVAAPARAVDPLRFVFPTPGPKPVSAWRPPLYQVPWALTPHDHFYFVRPIAADEVNWPLADYRYGGEFFADVTHTGVDIPVPMGTPVFAAGPGKVIKAGYGVYSGLNNPDDPYGLAVVLRHDFGYRGEQLYTVYGHLSEIDVVEGQILETGQPLGRVGDTGFTTGPHLHFEVRIGENRFFTTRNPELWIAPPLGWGVLAGRVMHTNGVLAEVQEVWVKNLGTDQLWNVLTYGSEVARSDPFYRENLVLGDLPAGNYEISIAYFGILYKVQLTLEPGRVNYFTFQGRLGFMEFAPPTPDADFTPPPLG